MKYDITTKAAPKMPNLGKGTECIKLLTGQTSKDMHEPVVPLLFPPLAAHVCGAEFQYPDNTWKEVCGIMANIVADSGDNKGQLTPLVEALCRDFRLHDKGVTDELEDWARQKNTSCHPVARTSASIISLSDNPRLFSNNPALSANINGKPCCTMEWQQGFLLGCKLYCVRCVLTCWR